MITLESGHVLSKISVKHIVPRLYDIFLSWSNCDRMALSLSSIVTIVTPSNAHYLGQVNWLMANLRPGTYDKDGYRIRGSCVCYRNNSKQEVLSTV